MHSTNTLKLGEEHMLTLLPSTYLGQPFQAPMTVFTNGAIYLLLALGNSDCVTSAEIPKQKQAIKQPC